MFKENFTRRHIGPNSSELNKILSTIGVTSVEELLDQTIPENIRLKNDLNIPEGISEMEFLKEIKKLSSLNQKFKTYIGLGYHDTFTPSVIQRNILENPGWYTAYTPYQAEIAQGRLEALLNFQTMISDLTGLEIANASLLDEATACAEAMTMAQRISRSKNTIFFVDENCHPQNISVLKTRAKPLGISLIIDDVDNLDASQVFGAIFQYPGTNGNVRDFTAEIEKLHEFKAISVISADPLSLTLLKEPGAMGADIAVGTTQRFGVPVGYGGPHAAYMATKDTYKRSMPGRIVGVSIDANGNKAYQLALQTREQHIRREKATSNVCTAQALLAVMASFYAVFHGPEGLKAIAQRIHRKTVRLAKGLEKAGFKVEPDAFFDTITVDVGLFQKGVMSAAVQAGINLRAIGKNKVAVSYDETTRRDTTEAVWRAFGLNMRDNDLEPSYRIPNNLLRQSTYLEHEVFHMNRAETEMMRYMRRLSDRDLALDRAMIPLGSCTMKLNSAAEMMPVSWREFSLLHPFAPKDQAKGYEEIITDLSQKLCTITGYDAISMQPNSGAQGEYAGLLTIADYHNSRGESHRNVCLIPTSAHGTNPASAQMVGWKVVPVNSADNGDIDIDDFKAKAELYSNELAGCMITYPSTHGVFEKTVHSVCDITHIHGGQVYIDGANMNAMVGLSRPGDLGGDVSHLNLHKTFCIPHGGGGPGMGPIACKRHLQVYLPNHPVVKDCGPATGIGAVSAAPWGSSSILSISWMYIKMMGSEGLKLATQVAILNANYIAHRLKDHFPILYKGSNGNVAHECIIDIRSIKSEIGITEEDIAKRLIDYGFHAPTMSWPVAGTMMIEPTESESLSELDRFCDTLINIKSEIDKINSGEFDKVDNPIKNAPHTDIELASDEWDHKYSREQAAYPAKFLKTNKFWPPVARVDNVYGDKNIFCTCPSMDEFKEDAA